MAFSRGCPASCRQAEKDAALPFVEIDGPGWLITCAAVLVSTVGGFLILNYQRFALQTMRAIGLRAKHADEAEALERLRLERGEICDEVVGLSAGLELPGTVLPDGRVLDPPNL